MRLTLERRGDPIRGLAAQFPRVALRTLNRVGSQVRTQATKLICEKYNIRFGTVREAITVQPARTGNLECVVTVRGAPTPIIEFSAKQTAEGVQFSIRRGKPSMLPHVFKAVMPSGHKGVMERKPGWTSRFPKGRTDVRHGLPIEEKYTISVARMMGSKAILDAIEEFAAFQIPLRFRHELEYYMQQRR